MTADKELTLSDYLLIQQAASLAFGVVHNLMDRLPAASPEWDKLRAWNEKLGEIASAAYAAGRDRRALAAEALEAIIEAIEATEEDPF